MWERGIVVKEWICSVMEPLNREWKYIPKQELVRCKDCKHYRINTVYPGTNMIMTYCAKTGITESNPDWFCADGKHKKEGEME